MHTDSNKLTNIKLILIFSSLLILQLIINLSSFIYIDLLGILLLILLLHQLCFYRHLLLIAFIADAIGHWYLGTHLFALVLVSFISDKYLNFYKVSNFIQKLFMVLIYCILLLLIIAIIDNISHNSKFDLLSFILNAGIFCPLVMIVMTKAFNLASTDVIIND